MRFTRSLRGGEGAMDAANILKPALARGELRAIGATTLDEYQKEKDKALERRFQKIIIEEPDTESAISILRGIKEKYETHHKVQIKKSDYRMRSNYHNGILLIVFFRTKLLI
jgi:ATP-dependent Clp protease ATP-binding subunit ClpA